MSGMQRAEAEQALIDRAKAVLPAGSFGNMAADLVVREGKGGRVRDVSGNEYIDYLIGSGPMFVGHRHPEVVSAVLEQIARGTTFFANNEHGIALAEVICEAVTCADKVRFFSSGSEAALYAMRAARALRRRDKVLKFEGGFHGMSDYSLMSQAPSVRANFPQAVPDSAGIPRALQDDIIIAPFNDTATATALINEYHDQLGGVIVEPFQRLIPPQPGFLEALRDLTARFGIPLIFDEIVTGFRFDYRGAQEYYGVVPDMCTLGKIIGGGFPLAAIAGSDELMAQFDRSAASPDGFLPQIGTLSGNPVASVAGLATLAILERPGTYEKVFETGRRLMEGLASALTENGHAVQVVGEPPLFDVYFCDTPIEDYRGVLAADAAKASRFNVLLRQGGILKGESKFYISLAHDEDDVAQTLEIFSQAAKAL